MVYLRNKTIKGHEYYYLVASMRVNGKTTKIERFIGREKPSDEMLLILKNNFEKDIKSKNWLVLTKEDYELLETIKNTKHRISNDEQLLDFCINFTYNTNAIEENSLTHQETHDLLKRDLPVAKSFKDQIESFSHRKVFMEMINTKKPLSVALIKKWHKDLFEHTKETVAGKIRSKNVRVAGFKAPHYMDLDYLLKEFIVWYKDNKNKMHPIELAAMTHLKFVKIHPFEDGNGRLARLLLNYVLHTYGYPMMTVEYKHRDVYYHVLDEYDQTQEEEVFVKFILDSYLNEYGVN